MKYVFAALLLPVFLTAAAQDTTYNKITAAICQCTTTGTFNDFTNMAEGSPMANCIKNAMQQNATVLITAAQKKYGAAMQDSIQVFIEQLFKHQLIKDLVYTCDNFITLIDTARFYDDYSGNADSLKKVVADYNKMDRQFNLSFFYHRGTAYMHLREYKKAIADADSAIADKPKDYRSWELEEWALEQRHRWDEALAACKKIEALDTSTDENTRQGYQILEYMIGAKKKKDGK